MILLYRRDPRGQEPRVLEFETYAEAWAEVVSGGGDRIRCDSCEASRINGVFCHEHGCPGKARDNNEDPEEDPCTED